MEAKLEQILLRMKKLNVGDLSKFKFIDPPLPADLKDSIDKLKLIDALDNKENITELGSILATMPTDPQVSKAIIEGMVLGVKDEVTQIIAMMAFENNL